MSQKTLNLNNLQLIYQIKDTAYYRTDEGILLKTHVQVPPERETILNLEKEFLLLNKFHTPNIVRPIDLIQRENHLYLVLENVKGVPLKEFIQNKKIDLETFFKIALQLIAIIAELHQLKIVNNDLNLVHFWINPDNFKITLMDLSSTTEGLMETSPILQEDSLTYASPEQTGRMNRMVDYRSNFYSLGIIFYELLTGQPPFQTEDPLELIYAHMAQASKPIPQIPQTLNNLIAKLLSKNAEGRYFSAAGIYADLKKLFLAHHEKVEIDFELGQEDIKNTFTISQKLYGREFQIQQIQSIFKQFNETGKSHFLLITASSGIGKTSLIQEIHKILFSSNEIFAKGKCDILKKNEPYLGFKQAFQELSHYFFSQKDLTLVKKTIQEALGSTGKAIVEIFPDLQLLGIDFPELENLNPKESQNRLHSAFERLFKIIASQDHPLILFFDDLQGVDQASMDLIHYLHTSVPNLFLIGAYREEEVSSTHPLALSLKEIENKTFIPLPPLSLNDIEKFLEDSLERKNVRTLAELLLQKTSGNPFFVKEFLKALYHQGLIQFEDKKWTFDFSKIQKADMTDNVIHLMIKKIQALSPESQKILCMAACIGGHFNLKTLAIVTQKDPSKLGDLLKEALLEGLLLTEIVGDEIRYYFLHDKVQEAAYQMIAEDRSPLHLTIARHLSQQGQSLFDVLDHYNRALPLITEYSEKQKVIELSVQAAKLAKFSNAYSSALTFLQAARSLLLKPEYEIEKDYAELLFLLGRFDEAERLTSFLEEKTPNTLEKLKLFNMIANQECNRGQFNKAIDKVLEGLKIIGINLPRNPSSFNLMLTYLRFKFFLFFYKNRLENSPLITKSELLQGNELFAVLGPSCYLSDNHELYKLSILEAIIFGLRHGLSSASLIGHAGWVIALVGANRFKEAPFWQALALKEAARINSTLFKGKIHFLHAAMYAPWFIPLKNHFPLYAEATKETVESGDFTYLGYTCFNCMVSSFMANRSLRETEQEVQKTLSVLQRSKGDGLYEATLSIQNMFDSLQAGLQRFSPEKFQVAVSHPSNQKSITYTFTIYSALLYIFKDYEHAYEMAKKAEKNKDSIVALLFSVLQVYFSALSLCKRGALLTKEEQKDLHNYLQKLKIWAEQCPENYLPLHLHLSALTAPNEKALELFKKAISEVEKQQYFLFGSLISESAAEFCEENNLPTLAKKYMQMAHLHYTRWGAKSKAEEIAKKYPEWFTTRPETRTIDSLSVIKAAQALSSEIILSRLLKKLLGVVKENAGAERVVILNENEGEFFVEAEIRGDNEIEIYDAHIADEHNLPTSFLNYIHHSKKFVVLDNASLDQLHLDPYWIKNSIKSVLCMPMHYLSKVVGILYLENNLLSGAFTEERIETLKLLASQAALSLENARLYAAVSNLTEQIAGLSEQKGNEELLKTLQKAVVTLETTRLELKLLKQQKEEPIAIIGMGCRFPGGANHPTAFWDLLQKGFNGMREIPKERWDVDAYYDSNLEAPGKMYVRQAGFLDVPIDQFDAEFFGISPHEAEYMDPQQRLLMEVTWEALENGGINPKELKGSSTGVFVGVMMHDFSDLLVKYEPMSEIDAYQVTGNANCVLPGRISYFLGLQGPSFPIDTACSSSLVALHEACQSLRNGECSLAIAGGVNLIMTPEPIVQMCKAHMLSADGFCKTFDAKADGYARGEGCGIVILKRLSEAQADGDPILALVKSSGINQDGASSGLTVPNGNAQTALLKSVWAKGQIDPAEIHYMEAHGTGTSLGDPIEINAIRSAFEEVKRDSPLWISSVKTNIGHLESAAGVAGIVKVVLSLQNETIPPHLHLEKLNPHIQLEDMQAAIPLKNVPWQRGAKPRLASISSFGIGGTNSYAVLEEAPRTEEAISEDSPHLLTLSAKSEKALQDLISLYIDFLEKHPHTHLGDLCFTANTGRTHFEFRTALIGNNLETILEKLKNGDYQISKISSKRPKIALYSKNGQSRLEQILPEIQKSTNPNLEGYEVIECGDDDLNSLYEKLAKLYRQGIPIDWKGLYSPKTRRKIALPTYPFQRKRHWPKMATPQLVVENSWFYETGWELKTLVTQEKSLTGQWVVLSDSNQFAKGVIAQLQSRGCTVIENKMDFDNCEGVIFSGELGSLDLLKLFQSLIHSPHKPTLWILTKGVFPLDEFPVSFSSTPLVGLRRTALLEHPEIKSVHIDIDNSIEPQIVLNELLSHDQEDQVVLRKNCRYVLRLRKLADVAPTPIFIDPAGSYLITGGLGGLGFKTAEWLSSKGAKHLVLSGRSQPTEEALEKIKKLKGEGIQVETVQLDVADKKAVDELIGRFGQKWPILKGVFHGAGVLEDGILTVQNEASFNKVFAPKVAGSWNLHEATLPLPLDFFVLYSSIGSVLGFASQSNYAAANAYMDGLAHFRKQKGLPAQSISWGPWSEIGLAAKWTQFHEESGIYSISPTEGLKALEYALHHPKPHVLVAKIDWNKLAEKLPLVQSSWLAEFFPVNRKSLKEKNFHENGVLNDYLQQEIASLLHFSSNQVIDVDQNLFDIGLDSLSAVQLRNKLKEDFQEKVISSTLIFENPTIASLSKYLAD